MYGADGAEMDTPTRLSGIYLDQRCWFGGGRIQ